LRITNLKLATVSAIAVAALYPAQGWAEEATAADGRSSESDIVVLGKSYGAAVGKTVTPLKDIPNTVTLVDREQIEAQNLFTLEDALTATPGITVTGVGSEDPSYMSRGFAITNYLLDGTPTMSFAFPAVVPDLFFYDRLEVLRGPAGLFSGSGNPAGSINLVRKRPLEERSLHSSIGLGSYDDLRAEFDISQPLGSSAAVRFGAMTQDQDQFFDVAHRNRVAAFGVAKIDLGERTTFTAGGNYDRFKPAVQSGLPGLIGGLDGSEGQLLDVPRSTYLGADWNRFRSEVWTAFADVTHQLDDRWTIRASGLYSKVDRIDIYSYIGNQPVTPASGVTSHIAFRGDSFMKNQALDLNAVGSFSAFGRDHTLILGADYQDSSYQSYTTRLSNYARINVYDPVSPFEPLLDPYRPSPYYPVQGTGATCPNTTDRQTPEPLNCVLQNYGGTDTKVEQYGAYGQTRISLVEGLSLIGGGRFTWWKTTNQVLLPSVQPETGYKIQGRFTPYAGIVWDVTGQWNVYASYADSFTPQAAPAGRFPLGGGQVKPLLGSQYEAGTKLSLINDKLLLSGAVYQIEQTNRLFNDPDNQTVVLQIGKVRARGIEAEAAGEILPGWRINGGYTYTRTKYLEDQNASFEGLPLVPIIPRHSFKAFTNYKAPEGALKGLNLGGALTWFSSTYGGNPAVRNAAGGVVTRSTIVRQGSYATIDLRAGYDFDECLSLSVNVNNVFDKIYYARISSTGRGNYYGTPRTVFATLRFAYP
jgi:outer membrane receptor for ferric coprogen and ferric-rhodotorulic acid